MPDISISREQQAYIDALRDELDAEMAYGHVRVQDAVQYLIDHHSEDGDLDVEIDPGRAEETPSGDDGSDGGSGGEGSDGDGDDSTDSDGDDDGTDSDDGADEASGDDGDDGDDEDGPETTADGGQAATTDSTDGGGVDDAVAALGNAGPGGGGATNDDGSPDGETTGSESAGTVGGDGGKVEEMMNLMDAHDDVWEETDSSQGKYSVELPDGESETVATKDDVRALLFKHYR